MDKRNIHSDKITTSTKKKRLIITSEQKFDVTVQHKRGYNNSKLG
jgi:hypothetical protein